FDERTNNDDGVSSGQGRYAETPGLGLSGDHHFYDGRWRGARLAESVSVGKRNDHTAIGCHVYGIWYYNRYFILVFRCPGRGVRAPEGYVDGFIVVHNRHHRVCWLWYGPS